ncbi:hypothetical protein DUNSADRAFT_11624 [Dunaliella salina]|uniref:ubiquitinyl hydrolase 1 n=1 Tax=Dunaliella salina TaxID=3046 RepID=A0ABQ7GCX3_DUNSA|nr:hypothetical protein DUNSADRAFT_11624 [Dunaliella salina]|eukprot:KAF5832457.1 hypothetical protein DUNSADRAFT_11624 [Dunaliella salina]
MPPRRKAANANVQENERELIAQLQSGSLPAEQKLRLVKGDVPACVPGTCKANNKANPNCLCGWVPAESGYKKKGLWQRETGILSSFGTDPRVNLRGECTEGQVPCGLNNLGNTCYVNTALQCLFMIPSFRRALFEVQPPVADNKIVQHLRSLFLALAFGPQRSADPSAFAQSLKLDHSTQQKCNQQSESSQNSTDFYELALQVKDLPGLIPSLTMNKAKASNKFAFPLVLDMGLVMASVAQDTGHTRTVTGSDGQPVGMYDLAAVLIHKGTSASRGHYVAHIKDEAGMWWRYDDETVTQLGSFPLGEPSDHGSANTAAAASTKGKGGRLTKRGGGKKGSAASSEDPDYGAVEDESEDEVSGVLAFAL